MLAEFLEELGDGLLVQISILGVHVQPGVEMLFRPEEVVHHSPTPLLDPDVSGIGLGDLPGSDLNGNAVAAVGAGVVDFDAFAGVSTAVDQQQEVHCSPYIEGLFPFYGDGVKVMA